jgi:hypothetical protein
MAAETMETRYCDNDDERRALKAALVEEIRKHRAAGRKVDVLMAELRKLDDPWQGMERRADERLGRSQRHAGGRAEVITQRQLANE